MAIAKGRERDTQTVARPERAVVHPVEREPAHRPVSLEAEPDIVIAVDFAGQRDPAAIRRQGNRFPIPGAIGIAEVRERLAGSVEPCELSAAAGRSPAIDDVTGLRSRHPGNSVPAPRTATRSAT